MKKLTKKQRREAERIAWRQQQREERAQVRKCPNCHEKRELLICGNKHGFVICSCRARICPICDDTDGLRCAGPPPTLHTKQEKPPAELERERAALAELAARPRLEIPLTMADRKQQAKWEAMGQKLAREARQDG